MTQCYNVDLRFFQWPVSTGSLLSVSLAGEAVSGAELWTDCPHQTPPPANARDDANRSDDAGPAGNVHAITVQVEPVDGAESRAPRNIHQRRVTFESLANSAAPS